MQSQSLNNITTLATTDCLASALNCKQSFNNRPASIVLPVSKFNYPLLKICPSTPTPSESDGSTSQFSPNKCLDSKCTHSLFPFLFKHSLDDITTSRGLLSASNTTLYPTRSLGDINSKSNSSICTNKTESNLNQPLLVPFISNTATITTAAHYGHNQHHNRSLNDINGGNNCAAETESPNLKSLTSALPQSTPPSVTGNSTATSNRSKLSPSPSKSGSGAAAVNATQSDSLSSTTTTTNTSTATTIIPKEMGEMCRRSSDSDLSVTPKGKFWLQNNSYALHRLKIYFSTYVRCLPVGVQCIANENDFFSQKRQ